MITMTAIEGLISAIELLERLNRAGALTPEEAIVLQSCREARDTHLHDELKRERARDQVRALSRRSRSA